MTMAGSQSDPSALLRADGSVVVPAEVAGEVLRALVRDTTSRVRVDGGQATPGLRTLLYALHTAAERPAPAESGSDTGSATAPPATVVTVSHAAALLECSPRWVRSLIQAGRLDATRPGAGCWLITQTSLDAYRRGNHDRKDRPGGRRRHRGSRSREPR